MYHRDTQIPAYARMIYNGEKKSKAIKLLMKLMYDESTPLKPYLIIPNENDQRMETMIR